MSPVLSRKYWKCCHLLLKYWHTWREQLLNRKVEKFSLLYGASHLLIRGGDWYHPGREYNARLSNIRAQTCIMVIPVRVVWITSERQANLNDARRACGRQQEQLRRDQSTQRILAVGAAAADPHSCEWRQKCCCCCIPARLRDDVMQVLELRKNWPCLSMNSRVNTAHAWDEENMHTCTCPSQHTTECYYRRRHAWTDVHTLTHSTQTYITISSGPHMHTVVSVGARPRKAWSDCCYRRVAFWDVKQTSWYAGFPLSCWGPAPQKATPWLLAKFRDFERPEHTPWHCTKSLTFEYSVRHSWGTIWGDTFEPACTIITTTSNSRFF